MEVQKEAEEREVVKELYVQGKEHVVGFLRNTRYEESGRFTAELVRVGTPPPLVPERVVIGVVRSLVQEDAAAMLDPWYLVAGRVDFPMAKRRWCGGCAEEAKMRALPATLPAIREDLAQGVYEHHHGNMDTHRLVGDVLDVLIERDRYFGEKR
jgi:hypothetical protein